MNFWEQQAKAKAPRKVAPPSAQNAPAECAGCSRAKADVMFGLCGDCDGYAVNP